MTSVDNKKAFIIVSAMVLAYAIVFSVLHIVHHHGLGSSIWDLGIYVNTLWNTIHGNILDCSILSKGSHTDAHFDPILILISPIMLINPPVEALLVFQSIWIASGMIPLYLIANHQLKRPWFGIVLCLVYFFHPAIHGMNLFDFHSLTLAAPLMLWAVYFVEMKRPRLLLATLALLLITREDMGVIGALLGIHYLTKKNNKYIGIGVIVSSIFYLIVVKKLVMAGGTDYSDYVEGLGGDSASSGVGFILSILSNPGAILSNGFTAPKALYLVLLAAPLLFMPLYAGRMAALFIYGLLVVFFASKPAVYSISFQYSTFLLPFMLAATPYAVDRFISGRIPRKLGWKPETALKLVAAGMLIVSVVLTTQFGALVPNDRFRAGYQKLVRSYPPDLKESYEFIQKIKEEITQDASVSASSRIGSHFAARMNMQRFPRIKKVDYVVLYKKDLKKDETREAYEKLSRNREYNLKSDEHGILVYERRQ